MKNMIYTLGFYLIFIALGCSGCGGVKEGVTKSSSSTKDTSIPKDQVVVNNDKTQSLEEWYVQNPQYKPVTVQRNAFGKEVTFQIDPKHEGGEAWTTVWQEKVDDKTFERNNRICQLSPTVILYRRFPNEVAKDFYYVDQAEKLEFLDTNFQTIKTVDIWKNRPYQKIGNTRITYHHFDAEAYNIVSSKNQPNKLKPNEYTLHTYVRSEGEHVIVNYELRSLITERDTQNDYEYGDIIGVKHTLRIYNLRGDLKYELKDLPSIDEAVVSNNGEYMMYAFGGASMATANSPFGTMDRPGWALMRLQDLKVVYQEYTDDGKLAFNRLSMQQSLLLCGYSTPNDKDGVYDYFVFYDQDSKSIYKKLWTHEEWSKLSLEWNTTKNKFWKYYIKKFNFQQIPIAKQ